MATVTEFVWDEAKGCKVPVVREVSIGELNDTPSAPVAPATNEGDITVNTPASVAAVEDSEAVKAAKAQLLAAKHALAAAQGKPVGKKGKPKVYNFKRVMLGAQVSEEILNKVKALMPAKATATDIVNLALDTLLSDLQAQAAQTASETGDTQGQE